MSTDLRKEDILGLIEDQPLNPFLWRHILMSSQKEKDFFRSRAVSALIEGLERRKASGLSSNGLLSTTDAAILLRLPVAKNIRPILKELGRFFLNVVRDPQTARLFCQQALETGVPDADCDAMLTECNREMALAEQLTASMSDAVVSAAPAPTAVDQKLSLASRSLANSTALALARIQQKASQEKIHNGNLDPFAQNLLAKPNVAADQFASISGATGLVSNAGPRNSGSVAPPPNIKTIFRTTKRLPASAMAAVAAASATPVEQTPLESEPAGRAPNVTVATRGDRESIHVTETRHCKPKVSKLIVRTGKLSLIAAMAAALEAEAQAEAQSPAQPSPAPGPKAIGNRPPSVRPYKSVVPARPGAPPNSARTASPLQAHQAAWQAQKQAAAARSGDFTKPLEVARTPHAAPATIAIPTAQSQIQPAAGASASNVAAAELLEAAFQALANQDLVTAEQLGRDASHHHLHPDQELAFEFWTSLGQHHFQAGRLFKAAEAYRKAMHFGADHMPAWFNMALALQHTGQLQEALHHYMRADSMEKDHPKVWCNLGALYFQLDRFAEAENALRKVVHIRPDYARAWDNLGAALAAQDKLVDASRACLQAVKYQPEFPEAWFRLGAIRFQNDDLTGAESAFDLARRLPGFSAYTQCYLAMIYARQGKTQPAEEAIHAALEADKDCELLWMAWTEIAQMYLNRSEFEKAASAYERAVFLQPEEFYIWFNLGLAHEHRSAWTESKIAYETAALLRDDSSIVWLKLAHTAAMVNDHTATVTALHHALELQPQDSDRWHELGLAYARCDMPEDSQQAFTHADQLRRQQNLQITNLPYALEVARRLTRRGGDEDSALNHDAAA
ncbi:MAG TPA: tetratricopeptide repeat protein [Candidatus Methylacidiphilales bacterium]|nr:tetratricopeptide repeat protein [Candidatus Methylacidiphilales bacterium]